MKSRKKLRKQLRKLLAEERREAVWWEQAALEPTRDQLGVVKPLFSTAHPLDSAKPEPNKPAADYGLLMRGISENIRKAMERYGEEYVPSVTDTPDIAWMKQYIQMRKVGIRNPLSYLGEMPPFSVSFESEELLG